MRAQTSIAVKVCGLTKTDQAKEIAALGVDAIGVIGVEQSPRYVSKIQRRNIFSQIDQSAPTVQRVWVIADLTDNEIEEGLTGEGLPSIIQLHGQESPRRCKALRKKYKGFQWWKALRIRERSDLSKTIAYENYVDAFLLDAWSPEQLGGTGKTLPLNWLPRADLGKPWWLAGGIAPESISEIIKNIRPYGIDASSKLEISPGLKDLRKVRELIKQVRK